MSSKARPSIAKRQKERAREEKRRMKAERRAQRKQEKAEAIARGDDLQVIEPFDTGLDGLEEEEAPREDGHPD